MKYAYMGLHNLSGPGFPDMPTCVCCASSAALSLFLSDMEMFAFWKL